MMTANMYDSELFHEMWGKHVLPYIFTGKHPHEFYKGNVHSYKYLKVCVCVWGGGCIAQICNITSLLKKRKRKIKKTTMLVLTVSD